MRDALADSHPTSGSRASTIEDDVEGVRRSGLAWRAQQLRVWDLMHLVTPWLLLAVSTAIYFSLRLRASAASFWPEGASVLTLVAVCAVWTLFGHTVPLRRGTLRPLPAGIHFVGLLVLSLALMSYSDVFVIFTIAGFFHAYLLSP